MPVADHSDAFWTPVAQDFKPDQAVAFHLVIEPLPDQVAGVDDPWGCWRKGCFISDGSGKWTAAGMQALTDAVRTTGARQPILLSGLACANDLSGWLANEPDDPAHQLVAACSGYPDNACNNGDCWERNLGALSARVPVVASEVGDEVCSAGSFASRLLPTQTRRASAPWLDLGHLAAVLERADRQL